jgi:plasmid stabilization system protein ParE
LKFGATSRRTPVFRWQTGLNQFIRDKIVYLAERPGRGALAQGFDERAIEILSIYSYLIVYRPETSPLQVVAILHGRRDVEELLKDRL